MDKQLLAAFIAVAENKNFTAAANQLQLTQSAISKRIAQLEAHLGQVLFDRMGRSIALTEAGQALLPKAKIALEQIEAALQSIVDVSPKVGGRLRIATSHHIGVHRLPAVLKRYVKTYPEVHLDLSFIDSERAIDSVSQGEYELAFVTLPEKLLQDPLHPLQHQVAWQDPLVFVCGRQHPLAQNKRFQLKRLSQYAAILPDHHTYTTQLVQRLFHQHDLSLDITMTTNHLDAIKMMISVGLGWSVLPRSLLSSDIVELPAKYALNRTLGCIYRRRKTLKQAARAMLLMLR